MACISERALAVGPHSFSLSRSLADFLEVVGFATLTSPITTILSATPDVKRIKAYIKPMG